MESENTIICLTNKDTRVKVSSTLKGSPENTKDKLFDGKVETSWYSNQGKLQYIYVYFDEPVKIKEINFNFDGIFGPKEIEMSVSKADEYENSCDYSTSVPCVICGKPILNEKVVRQLRLVAGGEFITDCDGNFSNDLGWFPVGIGCYKKFIKVGKK